MKTRNIIRLALVATALEPIIHGGERSGGTVTEFRREKVRVGGDFEYLPVVSANSIAGITRDNCAYWCLDQLPKFTRFTDLRAFDLLTGGGNLVAATGDKYVNLFEEAQLREMFPVISLFGGSVGNRILGGRVDFSAWTPVCEEWSAYLPEAIRPRARGVYMADLLQILNWTRRDDKKNRAMQDLIDPDTLAAWQRGNAARERNAALKAAGFRWEGDWGEENFDEYEEPSGRPPTHWYLIAPDGEQIAEEKAVAIVAGETTLEVVRAAEGEAKREAARQAAEAEAEEAAERQREADARRQVETIEVEQFDLNGFERVYERMYNPCVSSSNIVVYAGTVNGIPAGAVHIHRSYGNDFDEDDHCYCADPEAAGLTRVERPAAGNASLDFFG